MRLILLALAVVTADIAGASAQSSTNVPAALSTLLDQYGCSHVADDAEVPRKGRRWWISLNPFTGGDADFAFYCQDRKGKRFSRLILAVRKNNPWRGCDAVVDSENERFSPWFPTGLAVVNARSLDSRHADLSQWWLVSSSRNSKVTYGPAGVKVPDPIIDTTADSGAGTLYACYSRQWYRIGLD